MRTYELPMASVEDFFTMPSKIQSNTVRNDLLCLFSSTQFLNTILITFKLFEIQTNTEIDINNLIFLLFIKSGR